VLGDSQEEEFEEPEDEEDQPAAPVQHIKFDLELYIQSDNSKADAFATSSSGFASSSSEEENVKTVEAPK
jgi:hypothetical protein